MSIVISRLHFRQENLNRINFRINLSVDFWVIAFMSTMLILSAMLSLPAHAQSTVTTITYFHNDISGTPMLATDAAGNVVWKENYRPYGERVLNQAANNNNTNKIGYAGKPFDNQTGLTYMGARYYDPVLGRFMGIDPKGVDPDNIHSFNRYAYANNNPYKFVDPDGRSPLLAIPLGLGVLVIGGGYYALAPPDKQRDMLTSIGRLSRAIKNAMHAESAESGNKDAPSSAGGVKAAPPVPSDLVGDQGSDSAGLTKNGKRHTSGPMTPENGGTGDASKDFDKLTGGNVQPAGGTYPPGTLVGPNGVVLRPGQKSSGPRIDIPGNGSKPPETLHY